MEPLIVDEFTSINDQLQKVVQEIVKAHAEEETSKGDSRVFICDENIKEDEEIEIETKERMEEKNRLIEGLCFFLFHFYFS